MSSTAKEQLKYELIAMGDQIELSMLGPATGYQILTQALLNQFPAFEAATMLNPRIEHEFCWIGALGVFLIKNESKVDMRVCLRIRDLKGMIVRNARQLDKGIWEIRVKGGSKVLVILESLEAGYKGKFQEYTIEPMGLSF